MPTNLRKETMYQQLVRGIQDEFASQWIHDGLKVKTMVERTGLAAQTVKRNLNHECRFPWMQTILALSDGLGAEIIIKGSKVTINGRVAKLRKAGVRPTIIKVDGKPVFKVYTNKGKIKPAKAAKMINPQDANQTWAGRGRKPNWLLALEAKKSA